jgi:hypothetical protein
MKLEAIRCTDAWTAALSPEPMPNDESGGTFSGVKRGAENLKAS